MNVLKRIICGSALVLMVASLLPSVAVAASPTYPTTSLSPNTPVQTTFQSQPAVVISYTDGLSGSTLVLVYMSIVNSMGQTVQISVATISAQSGQTNSAYLLFKTLPAGTYTGEIFATSVDAVPLSSTSTVSITA